MTENRNGNAGEMNRSPMLDPEQGQAVLGELVHGMRRARGWSRRQLAEAAGVNQDTIANVEMGLHLPRHETLRRIGLALIDSDAPWEAPRRPRPASAAASPPASEEPPVPSGSGASPALDGLVLVSRTVVTTETWGMREERGDDEEE